MADTTSGMSTSRQAAAGYGLRAGAVAVGAIVLATLLWVAAGEAEWVMTVPAWMVIPLADWVSVGMDWLMRDAAILGVSVRDVLRGFSSILAIPLDVALAALARGAEIPFGAVDIVLPPFSWIGVAIAALIAAWQLGGRRLTILTALTLAYLVLFGQWVSAMTTFASIAVAVPIGVGLGLVLGILAFMKPSVERALTPVLDLMQTVPVFAYLVPVLVMFGFGPVSAMVATVIYATPPMVRMTIVALRGVPPETLEFGTMAGCTRLQMIWRILLPSARSGLMVGANQVVMLSLNMVIIASMIGAGGLGYDVLTALRRLQIGAGLEAGVAITLIAIVVDRFGQALSTGAARQADLPLRWILPAVLVAFTVLAVFVPALAVPPDYLTVSTSSFWDAVMTWINVELYDFLNAIKTFLLIYVLLPAKRLLLALPWIWVVGVLAALGWSIGGLRLAALVALLCLFIALTGFWEPAMVAVYLCGVAVIIAAAIGIPVGVLSAKSERVHGVTAVVVDTLQTMPSFVYLIPVVMLFQVGDFAALVAIVAYAVAPAIRYTDHGIRGVSAEVLEGARMMGCTPRQILWRIQLPLALPEILVGLNQTIMMALSMLVITALVGTRDLGQEVYIALTQADIGQGLVAGLCVAAIAIIADRLIKAAVARRRANLADT
ncbi:ABC transporter permease subunit [Fodinicurvata sp. EGI_FJ10296]|uniref:ABC transporter permease n=1 Tax=Fodinicurvata sp. EGI_FJ10296 TaxID=3231908 RepID=UPI0034551E0E